MSLPEGTRLGTCEVTGSARALEKEYSHPFWSPTDPDRYVIDYPSFSPEGKTVYISVARKPGDIYQLEGF